MASVPSVVVRKFGDMDLSVVTITWDNADLTCQDIPTGLAKGVQPVVMGHYATTAGTNVSSMPRYVFDNVNGEVDIVMAQEVGGSIANLVTVHTFACQASTNQDGTTITP